MTVKEYNRIQDNNLNIELEQILQESQFDIHKRVQTILLEIDTHTISAKKEVHLHIRQLVKMKTK